jgi:drug/metabolite transporter (DMT)-like permease
MFKAIFRVLFGYVMACLAAALTKVLFAVGPNEVTGGDPEKIATVIEWIALTATHSAVFAAPFTLLSAAISEWQSIRGFVYHVLVGIGIAIAGFAAQYFGEAPGTASIFNTYAIEAYAATGLVGGLFYWLFAGRRAGHQDDIYRPAITQPTRQKTPAAPPPSKSTGTTPAVPPQKA